MVDFNKMRKGNQPDRPAASNPAAIEKHQPDSTMAEVPEYLRRQPGQGQAAGLENMDRQDVTLPRLGLCQSMSPQRIKSDPKFIAGLEEGNFFNTITQENYGNKVRIIPLLFYKTRLRFRSFDDGGGLLCQSPDSLIGIGDPGGNCLRCPFQMFKDNAPPECTLLFNYASLVVGKDGTVNPGSLVVDSFKSSGLSTARDWNSLIRLRQVDMFAGIYEIESADKKEDKYTWKVQIVKPAGWVSKETYVRAKEAYQAMAELQKEGRLRHDVEDLRPGGGESVETNQM